MQPRKHRDQAARQKAYRQRVKARKQAALDGVRVEVPDQDLTPFVQRVQGAGEAALAEFFGRRT